MPPRTRGDLSRRTSATDTAASARDGRSYLHGKDAAATADNCGVLRCRLDDGSVMEGGCAGPLDDDDAKQRGSRGIEDIPRVDGVVEVRTHSHNPSLEASQRKIKEALLYKVETESIFGC